MAMDPSERANSARSERLLARTPLHPVLLAAYPILFLYAANLAEVLPVDIGQPLAWAVAATALLWTVASVILRSARRAALVTSALVAAWFSYGHLAPLFRGAGLADGAQLALWAVLIGAAAVVAVRARASMGRITEGLNIAAIVLVALTLASIVPYELSRAARGAQAAPPPELELPAATRHPGRDIFYLVFDRYGSDWSIDARFGIDNSAMSEWLEGRGFNVVPGARANYRATDFSLASTLQMRYLDELTERYGRSTDDRTPARELLQDHVVGRFLQANGYRYVHIPSWYGPTLDNPIADELLRWDTASEFSQVLSDSTMAPLLLNVVTEATSEPPHRERHRAFAEYQFRQVERAAAAPYPVFVFAHFLLPHAPYTYRADGSDMLDADERSLPEAELYAEQLAYTNMRIRDIVGALLDRPAHEQPIIVIQADEGPFLCFNVDCIDGSPETYGIRFGIQGAYYLPGLAADVLPPDHSAVNTFRVIFSEYFGADLPRLPDRSFDWPDNEHLYDFRDITDQLPLPGS
ncbi:MAG TPA: hypothetical protein VNT28_08730 [Candidatus Limnocylindrales bacterium]|nr:hypothetical protein [Candidatus Limnocylindrales bacterium]